MTGSQSKISVKIFIIWTRYGLDPCQTFGARDVRRNKQIPFFVFEKKKKNKSKLDASQPGKLCLSPTDMFGNKIVTEWVIRVTSLGCNVARWNNGIHLRRFRGGGGDTVVVDILLADGTLKHLSPPLNNLWPKLFYSWSVIFQTRV